jgi:hypothetical protein
MAETEFIDAESEYQNTKDDNYSFRIIVMRHLSTILNLGTKEFRGGYWRNKTHQSLNGITVIDKVYEPDTREEYSNAIATFYDLLLPKLDTEAKESIDKLNAEIEGHKNQALATLGKKDTEILPTEYYSNEEQRTVEEYRFKKVTLHRKLFQELSKFLERKNYLMTQAYED